MCTVNAEQILEASYVLFCCLVVCLFLGMLAITLAYMTDSYFESEE